MGKLNETEMVKRMKRNEPRPKEPIEEIALGSRFEDVIVTIKKK